MKEAEATLNADVTAGLIGEPLVQWVMGCAVKRGARMWLHMRTNLAEHKCPLSTGKTGHDKSLWNDWLPGDAGFMTFLATLRSGAQSGARLLAVVSHPLESEEQCGYPESKYKIPYIQLNRRGASETFVLDIVTGGNGRQ